MFKRLAIVMTLAALATVSGVCEDADPPSRAARLALLSGTVSLQPANVHDWTPAEMNRPLSKGDHLWTEADGKAELQTGNASLRLNGRTNFGLTTLTDRLTQIQITSGTVNVRLHTLASEETFEIDTPQLAFNLLKSGDYRVDVSGQGDATTVTVRAGEAEINAAGKTAEVQAGGQVRVTGLDFDRHAAPQSDDFDTWCLDRDKSEDTAVSARHVSRDIPGYADLDAAGSWRAVDGYGSVWFPKAVAAGWAPYRFGHWAFVAPWGWTWIDAAAWGYAPFHYGRWVQVSGVWGWVPGPIVVRPAYAPALVAFSNFDAGVAIAEPAIGWFPLGPGEVYIPSFHFSAGFLEHINLTNTVIADRGVFAHADVAHFHYMNREGAMTAVRHADFTGGRAVGRDYVHVSAGAIARGTLGAHPGLTPGREAMLGNRGPARGVPPRGIADRQVQTARNGSGHGRSIGEARAGPNAHSTPRNRGPASAARPTRTTASNHSSMARSRAATSNRRPMRSGRTASSTSANRASSGKRRG